MIPRVNDWKRSATERCRATSASTGAFFDRKSVERRTHHDTRLKFVRGLQLLHRRPGITQRRRGIGEMLQSRCQQLAFAPEMAMQQAVVHPGPCGDLTNRCGSRTLLRE